MIQRVQNLYLGLAFILAGLVLVLNVQFLIDASVQASNSDIIIIGKVFLVVILAFTLLIIFRYKKLSSQKLWLKFMLFINVLFILFISLSIFFLKGEKSRIEPDIAVNYFYFVIPIVLFLLCLLALRGVNKDIQLLSSADRLR